jgi:peptidoglycan/LPS O-acetylase OafA/YrhL
MGILRLLLALSVVASHIGPIFGFQMTGGALAVQSFFMISGFYMSLILNEKYIGVNSSFKLFITNRLLKIYPLYFSVLILSVLVCLIIGFTSADHDIPVFNLYEATKPDGFTWAYLITTNIIVWGQDIVMFMGISPQNGALYLTGNFWNTSPALYNFLFIPQGWSLALELTFYLCAPFLLRKRTSWILMVVMLSLLIRIVIYYSLNLQNDPWTYRFFPCELMFFLLGAISYRIYIKYRDIKIPTYAGLILQTSITVITIAFALLPQFPIQAFHFQVRDILYLFLILISMPYLFIYTKNNRFDSKIGDLSYTIYLMHLLVAKLLYAFGPEFLKNTAFTAIITILLSYFLNLAIAVPIERQRQKRIKKIDVTQVGAL